MELSARDDRRRLPKVKAAGVNVRELRALLVHHCVGDMWLSPSRAAYYCRRAQAVPSVTRQLVVLWAQRHGDKGTAYMQDETRRVRRVVVSLGWLVSFLERTGRGLEAPVNG